LINQGHSLQLVSKPLITFGGVDLVIRLSFSDLWEVISDLTMALSAMLDEMHQAMDAAIMSIFDDAIANIICTAQ
jgi:hypothetical protein